MKVHLRYSGKFHRLVISLGVLGLLTACSFAAPSSQPDSPANPQEVASPTSDGTDPQPVAETKDTQLVSRRISPPSRASAPDGALPDTLEPPPKPAPVFEADPTSEPTTQTGKIAPDNSGPIGLDARAGNAIKEYYISGFACTGSMRPALDCGDEGVFLKPPFTEPLLVGDIISFTPAPECRYYQNHDVAKAHRIIEVRLAGGATFYTTKGDTSANADPCEVTIEQIDGKLVEIRKGARPKDIIDTSGYDTAKELVASLKLMHADMKTEYNVRRADYNALVEEYEALIAKSQITQDEVNRTYQVVDTEVKSLNQMSQDLNFLGMQINDAIDEVDRIYQKLFIN